MSRIVENGQIQPAFLPVDMSGQANPGDYVSLKEYHHVALVFIKDAGTAAEDPTITVTQATAVDGTGAKALTFTDIYTKQAATNLTGLGVFTKTTQAAANTYTNGTLGEQAAVVVIEFDSDDLDVDSGFDVVGCSIADTGTTSGAFGTLIWVLTEPRFAQAVPLSAIGD